VTTAPARNWSGSHAYSCGSYAEPASLEELQEVVAAAERVRVLGTGHSFNAMPDTPGTLLSLRSLPDAVTVSDGRAHVGGGVPFARVVGALHEAGWALPNTGSLPHISVAGAVSTGTHGSGVRAQVLAGAVDEVTVVLGDGSHRTGRAGEPPPGSTLDGMVVGLGATGVVVGLGLVLEPTYVVTQELYAGLTWADLTAGPADVLDLGRSVSVFTRWAGADGDRVGEVLVKTRADEESRDVTVLGERVAPDAFSSLFGNGDNLTPRGTPGPWHTRMPHFRHDREPSAGSEQQSEWFVPLHGAAEAIEAMRRIADRLDAALVCSELRTIGADDLWLSPAHGRDTLAVHCTWVDDDALVGPAVAAVEEALAPLDPRPHWGKVFGGLLGETGQVYRLWPRAAEWREQRRALDPDGVFVNDWLTGLGLV
jgi:xylitol oxidase